MEIVKPVVAVSIRPKDPDDHQRLWRGLQALASDDSTFHVYTDREGRTVLAGMGELHLRIIIDRLRREFGVELVVGMAEVVCRETITTAADGEANCVSYADGRGQYVHVKLHLAPGQPGTGYVFANRAESDVADAICHAVDQGVREAIRQGIMARGVVDDLSVDLREISFQEGAASEEAFRVAGAMAFREAAKNAKPVLLEPVMRVEINVPEDMARYVMDDLARRGAEWISEETLNSTRAITVRALMSRMLGFGVELRQRTNGRGAHSMRVDAYQRSDR
jgi:elongation factor G